MSNKLVPIDPDLKERAREMFMQHAHFNDIAKTLQISTAALAKWRTDEGWLAAREAADLELLDDKTSARTLELMTITDEGIAQIKRTVRYVAQQVEPMTLAQAEKMAAVITQLDRITRLDRQQSTQNVAVKVSVAGSLTVDRIKEIVASDAFLGDAVVE